MFHHHYGANLEQNMNYGLHGWRNKLGRKHKLMTGVTVSTAGAPYSVLHNFGAILLGLNDTDHYSYKQDGFALMIQLGRVLWGVGR